MSRLFLALALVAAIGILSVNGSFFRRPDRFVGALNSRMSSKQLQEARQDGPTAQWLTQTLDHQDLSSQETFQQKYYVVSDYFDASEPKVLFILGGEGPVGPSYVSGHFIVNQYAQSNKALLVALEHRFYGSSVPNNDSSTANLRFLSSDQALEDLVTFHEQIQKQYSLPAGTPWIVFGGSYSGSLSAWARLKYPNLFLGSFSASAPVQAELDFSQYFEVVANSVGTQCTATIQAANSAVAQLLTSQQGITELVQKFNLCAAPANENDQITLLGALSDGISGVVQYNMDNNLYQPFNISTMCGYLTEAADPLSGLVQIWNLFNQFSGQTGCTDISYTNYIQSMQPTSDARSWTWQTCIEFGYFQTGEAGDQPFSPMISLDWFVKQCADIFGIPALTPNINWINNFYGGSEIVTSNTVFTNGDVDPWHILGNYQNYTPVSASQSILIHGTAHCADLYSQKPTDLPGLIAARATQDALLSEWLNQPTKTQVRPTVRKPAAKKILTE